ncbi:MAG: ATP-dependent helicase [Candidatus Saccharimonadales bacterium]
MSDFASSYKQLNEDQKAAVEYIEGPLLVIAGPGTGKTQLLSLRAANILLKTDASAENILCLTFTESGVSQMQSRLLSIIGDEAYKITISTYHGFGSELIRQNPAYFIGSINLRPINELKTDAIIRQLQNSLPFTSDFKSPKLVKEIARLISQAKQADLSPDEIITVATENLNFINKISQKTKNLTTSLARASVKNLSYFEQLLTTNSSVKLPKNIENLSTLWNTQLDQAIKDLQSTNKATILSQWKSKYLKRDENNQFVARGMEQNERLIEFSEIFKKYNDYLKEHDLYDYDDMILRSLNAIKANSELRYNLQEKYLYIMLDEYQDTNEAQAELIQLLTNKEVTNGQPNIMAVGDDDQAIYAFQGAKHSNMLDFLNSYNKPKVIALKTNYRSTQDIIELSSTTANQITTRLNRYNTNLKKNFHSANNKKGEIRLFQFANELEQYSWLANNLKSPVAEQIAIIAPEHKYLERASAYLIANNIPITYERKENILEEVKIEQIITVLRLLKAINSNDTWLTDSLLAIVLNYDFWQLPTKAIWQLSWQSSETNQPWLKLMADNPKTKNLALMLIKLAANSLSYRYDFIIDQVIGLSDVVINDPQPISTRSPFISYYEKEGDVVINKLFENLISLRQKFSEFNNDNNKPLMADELIEFVDQLKLSNEKIINDLSFTQSKANIELMSAHSAKGKEFDSVYLLSLVNEVWSIKRSNNHFALPLNLQFIRHQAEDIEDEKLRLLYVALTRAKTKLVALSYDKSYSSKVVNPLKYVNIKPTRLKQQLKPDLIPLWQKETNSSTISSDLKELLKKHLDNYSLSPTDLNTFIDVRGAGPKDFYNQVLLKYKSPLSPRMDYGSAIHSSLDWLQKQYKSKGRIPTLSQLHDEFELSLKKRRLMPQDYEHLKTQGLKALTLFYNNNKASFSKSDLSEYDFRSEGEVVNGVRITGKIDKLIIDQNSKAIEIVDYKTGKGSKNWSSPKLHLYSNQLYFYKLLLNNSSAFKNYQVIGGRLDFIASDSKDALSLNLKYDELLTERLLKLIKAVWQHINDLDFPSVTAYKPNSSGITKFEDDLISGKI